MTTKWWKESVVYQIYPRSFQDSNGDGIGDLRGHHRPSWTTSRSWASTSSGCRPSTSRPTTTTATTSATTRTSSPSSARWPTGKSCWRRCTQRGIKLVMDLVVNHTSDEHPWFIESASRKDNPYRDLLHLAAGQGRRASPTTGALLRRLGLAIRRDHGRILPAPVLEEAAGPELGEPRASGKRSTR